MCIFKIIINFIVLSFFLSCSSKPVSNLDPKPEVVSKVEDKQEPVQPIKINTFKRVVKDVNLKKTSDSNLPKKRIVVLPFLDSNTARSTEVLKKSYDGFVDLLNKTDELIALDSNQMKVDLNQFIKNGDYDLLSLARQNQKDGISAILMGRVVAIRVLATSTVAFEAVVHMRMINVRSEQEIFHMSKTVLLSEESVSLPKDTQGEVFLKRHPELEEVILKDAFFDFKDNLIESLNQVNWEGRIAAIQGEKFFLNVGKMTGVQVGDILKVVEDGSEIYDPEIGYHIGQVPGRIKGTLEIVDYFGHDGAISILHSGAGFKENDRIQLYQ